MSASIDRKTLLSIATLVRPALATAAYIPSLTHIFFDAKSKTAKAYNDVACISVMADLGDFNGCLPGELLIKALNSFSSDTVSVEQLEDGHAIIKSGRSKLKLATLAADKFPLPKTRLTNDIFEIDASIIKGVQMCLMSVGNDPTHAAQMGVTLDCDDEGAAVLFSTDNATLSRYQTDTAVKLPGGSPVIMPTFFCQQLINLWNLFPEEGMKMMVGSDFIMANVGKNKASLLSKVPPDLEALDFAGRFKKIINLDVLGKEAVEIPPAWDAVFQRAMLVLDGEVDKITELRAVDGTIRAHTETPVGQADDQMACEDLADMLLEKTLIDPSLILRASKHAARILFTNKVTALISADQNFVHLIAHCDR